MSSGWRRTLAARTFLSPAAALTPCRHCRHTFARTPPAQIALLFRQHPRLLSRLRTHCPRTTLHRVTLGETIRLLRHTPPLPSSVAPGMACRPTQRQSRSSRVTCRPCTMAAASTRHRMVASLAPTRQPTDRLWSGQRYRRPCMQRYRLGQAALPSRPPSMRYHPPQLLPSGWPQCRAHVGPIRYLAG